MRRDSFALTLRLVPLLLLAFTFLFEAADELVRCSFIVA